jgi:hypothetical protein
MSHPDTVYATFCLERDILTKCAARRALHDEAMSTSLGTVAHPRSARTGGRGRRFSEAMRALIRRTRPAANRPGTSAARP